MTNEEAVRRELDLAIANLSICIPMLEAMNGKIPSDILDKIDFINQWSVMF